MAAVYKLKGLALLQSRKPEKAIEAVDSFTDALDLDSGDNRIRQARYAALSFALNPAQVEASGSGLPSAGSLVKFKEMLRK